MSKIFEALERAKLKLKHFTEVSMSLPSLRLTMEDEMDGLYQAINSANPESKTLIIEFIGSLPYEGTSTIAREFAKVLAVQYHKRVLLIDADYIKPSHEHVFNLNIQLTLQKAIADNLSIDESCYQIPGSSLFVCRIAEDSSFVSNLCESPKLDYIWESLREKYDMILIDSPPASTSSVGFDFCRKVDKIALIVEAEKTRWPVVLNVKEKIVQSGGTILGVVFNKRKFYIPQWIYKRL